MERLFHSWGTSKQNRSLKNQQRWPQLFDSELPAETESDTAPEWLGKVSEVVTSHERPLKIDRYQNRFQWAIPLLAFEIISREAAHRKP